MKIWKHDWDGWYYPSNIEWNRLNSRKCKEYKRRIIRCLWLPNCNGIRYLYDDWRYETCKFLWEEINKKKYNYLRT